MVDVRPPRGGHVDEGLLRQLPRCPVQIPHIGGNLLDAFDGPLAHLDLGADLLVPQPAGLEVVNEVVVDLQELAGERLALEQVGELRLDALVRGADGRDRRRGRDGDEQRVAEAELGDALLEVRPLGLGRLHAPQVELERSLGRPGVGERLVGAVGLGELVGGRESPVVDLFLDARGKLRRPWVVEGEPQLEEDILQAHDSQTNGPPLAVRVSRRVGGVEVDVDHTVEVPHRCPDDLPEALEVEAVLADEVAEVERTQVAHSCLVLRRDLEDLSA